MTINQIPVVSGVTPVRSVRLEIPNDGSTTKASLLAAIRSVMLTHNWEEWDASAGTNTIVLRQLQLGGTSANDSHYTYVWLSTDTTGFVILRYVLDWNTTTKTATYTAAMNRNRSASIIAETQQMQPVNLAHTEITYMDVYCPPGGIGLRGYPDGLNGAKGSPLYGGVTLIAETLRDYPYLSFASGWNAAVTCDTGHVGTNGISYAMFNHPVGVGAIGSDNDKGLYSSAWWPGLSCTDSYSWSGYGAEHARVISNSTSGERFVSAIVPCIGVTGTSYVYDQRMLGRMRGICCVGRNMASDLDLIYVNVDSNYLPDPAGASAPFVAIKSAGGPVIFLLPL